jgi:hypothetical protein
MKNNDFFLLKIASYKNGEVQRTNHQLGFQGYHRHYSSGSRQIIITAFLG